MGREEAGRGEGKPAGHGRNGAQEYTVGRKIPIPHPFLQGGDACPHCRKGKARMQDYQRPAKTLERSKGHFRDWIDACKGGRPASSNFDYAGPMTEVILLGNLALRTGKKLSWDGPAMKATNAPEADLLIKPAYRDGWML